MARILIVQRTKDISELFRYILREQNQIIETSDGNKAMKLFEQFKPDLIIIHTGLPQINGYSVVGQIRRLDPTVKIIATSSNFSHSSNLGKMREAGADLCLSMPVDPDRLRQEVQNLMNGFGSSTKRFKVTKATYRKNIKPRGKQMSI